MMTNATPDEVRDRAEMARESARIVQVGRHEIDQEAVFSFGYVVGLSKKLIVINRISDRLDLDGYEVLRLSDITSFDDNSERTNSLGEVAKLKALRSEVACEVNIESIRGLLLDLARRERLAVIEREIEAPGECEIGRIRAVGAESYSIRWISPAARWEDDDRVYRLDDVTRVIFGGEYEETLARVAEARGDQ